jgi:hypothetical protein
MSAKLPPEDQLLSLRWSSFATVAFIVAALAFSVYLLSGPTQVA